MSAALAQPMFGDEWEIYDNHEVNGVEIRQRRNDGFIDATAIGKAYHTDFAHFERTAEATKFINALSSKLHICSIDLVLKERGHYGGTWIHPQIALRWAIMLSAEFAVDVTDWLLNWLQRKPDLTGASFQTRRIAATITEIAAPTPIQIAVAPADLPQQVPWQEMLGLLRDINATTRATREHQKEHSRGDFSLDTKSLARRTVFYKFDRRCPFSGVVILDENCEIILDDKGNPIAEYDHWHGATDPSSENCFLVLESVHQKLTGKKLKRSRVRPYFDVFQDRMAAQKEDDDAQISLFGEGGDNGR